MHILGTYGNIHVKYEVSMSNPVARMAVHMNAMLTHDGQSKIVSGSLVDKPNEPKTKNISKEKIKCLH